jgi:L-ascorbate metabolism protein UlaG (beta-lactamase superfamily)
MTLTWLGHSCFCLEEDGYRLVLDPYSDVDGYPPLHTQAHEVLVSHDHFDHNHVEAVELLAKRSSPFTVRKVETFHDDQQGALRGKNTIHIIRGGGLTVAHLGDLGHPLSREQAEAVGKCDLLMVPVGGFFTLDAAGAAAAVEALGGGTVVPMHYRLPPYGFPKTAEVGAFLAFYPAERVLRLSTNSFHVEKSAEGTRVVVPAFVI